MPCVKRYDSPLYSMRETPDGDYVSYADFVSLQGEIAVYKGALQALNKRIAEQDNELIRTHAHNKQLLFDNHHLVNRCNEAEEAYGREQKRSYRCPFCSKEVRQIIPAVANNTKERYRCLDCNQTFVAISTGHGTTMNPDKYLIRED